MEQLSLGLVGASHKPDEHRRPLHPAHFERIDAELRSRIFAEQGYGQRFGVSDEQLAAELGGVRSREQLCEECDILVLPKPLPEDLEALAAGTVLWGWPHCVQDEAITQLAIDRRLTLIAWEAMNHYTRDGHFSLHVFHRNNELAGYCSVLHALELAGTTGAFGPRLRAAVISFGATGRGAVAALFALGVHDVDVLTHRSVPAVAAPMAPARLIHYDHAGEHFEVVGGAEEAPVAEYLAAHDMVVNCVLQDPDDPLVFVRTRSSTASRAGASSSTSPATRAWASSGRVRPRSTTRCSPSATASSTTPSTTPRRCCGTPRRGRSARR
jgi:alanine dehydrogenase